MLSPLHKPRLLAIAAITGALAACGTPATGNNGTGNNPRTAGFRGNAIAGELVKIDGSTLTISSARGGDVKATLGKNATVETSQTVQLGDLTAGECAGAMEVTGPGGGTPAARAVTVFAPAKNGTCTLRGGGPGGAADGQGGPFIFGGAGSQQSGATPNASASPGPSGPRPRGTRVIGKVVSVSVADSTITVTTPAGAQATITVGNGATLTQISSGTVADLQTGDCVLATRPKGDKSTPSATTAVTVTSVTVVPAGPSGCFSGGGRGRFGGNPGQGGQGGQGQGPGGFGGPPDGGFPGGPGA